MKTTCRSGRSVVTNVGVFGWATEHFRQRDPPETDHRIRDSRHPSRCCLMLGAIIAFVSVGDLSAQPAIGLPEATPKTTVTGAPTVVTVTSSIEDPNLIPNSVLLQQVDAQGRVLAQLGGMHDDGMNGDAKAGDRIFSIQVPLAIQPGSPALLNISAVFQGTLGRVSSATVAVALVSAKLTIAQLDDLKQLEAFLQTNNIDTAAGFLEVLPDDFKNDWILMTATLSNQHATAEKPRVILQNKQSDKAFGFALDSSKVEYIQWDATNEKFRFHLIRTALKPPAPKVFVDDPGCERCHGVSGKGNLRPNWDAYDSWAGAMPYNRDRIYVESVEAIAMKRLFKGPVQDPILKQLPLPAGIARGAGGGVTITFDKNDAGGPKQVSYDVKDPKTGIPSYPGATNVNVNQGGAYYRMPSTSNPADPDEGRAVVMFDNFSGLNGKRVARELKDWDTSVVDIRPLALAIAKNCVDPTKLTDFAPQAAIDAFVAYHEALRKALYPLRPAIGKFDDLLADTLARQQGLPQIKANEEATNVKALIVANNDPLFPNSPVTITGQVARRSQQTYRLDMKTGFMIDRENYNQNNETRKIALFRFFLEPSHEPVFRWSMSVDKDKLAIRDPRTYTFGDVFKDKYLISAIIPTLEGVLSPNDCNTLKGRSFSTFDNAIKKNPGYFKY